MKKLSTIQKREKLNDVMALDEIGPGGANHVYGIYDTTLTDGTCQKEYAIIQFQKGPRKEENSIHGVIDTDLLEIVRDRLIAFQQGPFNSKYNENAIYHIEEALMWMNRRVEDRIERNVLGTNQK